MLDVGASSLDRLRALVAGLVVAVGLANWPTVQRRTTTGNSLDLRLGEVNGWRRSQSEKREREAD